MIRLIESGRLPISPHNIKMIPQKSSLEFTLLDYMDVSEEELIEAGHVKGPQCRCKQYSKLKDLEDRWGLIGHREPLIQEMKFKPTMNYS